jgi:hypothetical protein
VVALLVPYLLLVWRYWFLCDDAYITFRYSRNLARGHGVTYNIGEAPVEGYSNFLWMMLAAALESRLWSVELWIPLISTAIGAAFIVCLYATARLHFGFDRSSSTVVAAVPALFPPFAAWTTSGLATMPFAFLVFAVFERLVLARGRSAWMLGGLAALGLALTRTEGIAWVGVLSVLALASRLVENKGRDVPGAVLPLLKALGILAFGFVMYSVWRVDHFGDWLPNTAHAKVGFSSDRLLRGLRYATIFTLTYAALLSAVAGIYPAIRKRPGAGTVVALMSIAFPAYGVAVGGDFFPMGRMVIPSVAFAAILIGFAHQALKARAGAAVASVAAGAVLSISLITMVEAHLIPASIRSKLHFRLSDKDFMSEQARWENMVENTAGFSRRGLALRKLAHHEETLVSQAIGVVGYYAPDLFIFDQYGLVNREVAMLPAPEGPLLHSPGHDKFVEATYFAHHEPDYLATRVVQGVMASRLMKDTMEKWAIDEAYWDAYVPDFEELDLDDGKRSFLLMIRKPREGERPRQMWAQFADRRKDLLASFKGEGEEAELAENDS